ncbi:DUF421 domain-containing protein [Paenibacillus sp. GCM10028914]|uniref:DUF421 domain-containing protein n=1 Tax=Paenibacillus sp. GCM10028914 TaxID=3273416 RepID=UPI00360B0FA7
MFFNTWSDLFRIIIIGIISYISLILMVRLSGKRTLSQMNAYDFTVSVALGSILSTVILNKQISLSEGLTALALLIGMQFLLAKLSLHRPWFRGMLTADPQLLYYKGVYINSAMKKTRINKEDIYQTARNQGFETMDEVSSVVLESNGKLSIISSSNESRADLIDHLKEEL